MLDVQMYNFIVNISSFNSYLNVKTGKACLH